MSSYTEPHQGPLPDPWIESYMDVSMSQTNYKWCSDRDSVEPASDSYVDQLKAINSRCWSFKMESCCGEKPDTVFDEHNSDRSGHNGARQSGMMFSFSKEMKLHCKLSERLSTLSK
jgi:hypothetical protein